MPRRNLLVLWGLLLLTACGEQRAEQVFPAEAGDKIVLVNYWAEWCKPCREEIPVLNAFLADNAEEVALYGVNFDGVTGDTLERQVQDLGIAFPTLPRDPGPPLGWPQPEGLPYTMVTDAAGKKLLQLPGEQTAQSLQQALRDFRQLKGAQP